jgi:hypothetical protein
MLIAVLLTIAKKWRQPKCPSNDGQYIYIMAYYLAIKKDVI